jgi:membrane protein required for colicin V production
MTWVDFAVVGVLAVSGLFAFMRGLVREVLGIGAWIGAGFVAIWGGPLVRAQIAPYIPMQELVTPAAFAGVFLAALIILMIVSGWIGGIVRASVLGGLDRSLGLVFGLARGAILIIITYIAGGWVTSVDHWPPPVQDARLLPYVYEGAALLVHVLPPDYRPRLYAPPPGRETTSAALLHATPQGRAFGKPSERD